MLFRQLFDTHSCTFTYLVASGPGREALIIDPVDQHLQTYLHLLNELKLNLVFTIDTHIHADHITASGLLSHETNTLIAMGERAQVEHVSVKLHDGEKINIDGIELEAIYTPGHTDDSYSFYMKKQNLVFTGDTLLIRGTGRTDLPSGDPYVEYDSLFNRLLCLPKDTRVYPAHGYNDMTVSTISEEKNFNPRLQVRDRDEYAEIMNNLNLEKPKMLEVALPANRTCGI